MGGGVEFRERKRVGDGEGSLDRELRIKGELGKKCGMKSKKVSRNRRTFYDI